MQDRITDIGVRLNIKMMHPLQNETDLPSMLKIILIKKKTKLCMFYLTCTCSWDSDGPNFSFNSDIQFSTEEQHGSVVHLNSATIKAGSCTNFMPCLVEDSWLAHKSWWV